MTLTDIYDTIQGYALNTKGVEKFTIGDAYMVWNSLNMTYGAFNVYLNDVQIDEDYYIYHFTFYYGDKLKNDSSNIYDIQDCGFKVITNVFNHLIEDFESDGSNLTIYPFTQKFADILAGAYCDCNLYVPIEDKCTNYDKE